MKITFIVPAMGKFQNKKYIKSWLMEPLAIAVLSALTPPEIEKTFYDDRLDQIDYKNKTDIVAISVETYTARRAYQIADIYRSKGVTVVMGGFHVSLNPQDALEHADAVVIGAAENCWEQLLQDYQTGTIQKQYQENTADQFRGVMPDRNIYKHNMHKYVKLTLIESGRGCPYTCNFCSIHKFYSGKYQVRSIDEIIAEIKLLNAKKIFFVDDNIGVDIKRTKKFLKALIPLKIMWVSQVSMHVAHDDDLLELLRDSGCVGVLIGFESLNQQVINQMGKKVNHSVTSYSHMIKRLREYRLSIYGTFVLGYDQDTVESIARSAEFAIKEKLFLAAINHVVPFPGTELYTQLKSDGRLLFDKWWLQEDMSFGDVVYHPRNVTYKQLSQECYRYRKRFYNPCSLFFRATDFKANLNGITKSFLFFIVNIFNRIQVIKRQWLPLGVDRQRYKKEADDNR